MKKAKNDTESDAISTMNENIEAHAGVDDRGITEQQKLASQALDESKEPLKLPNEEEV
ncbi:MAG TPA: hypothetical protein V6C76_06815 [Drouetiella sp.]